MKTLLILRHAHAEVGGAFRPDSQRPLSRRGQEEAGVVAQRLAAWKPQPALFLVSTAERARSTAEAVHRMLPEAQVVLEGDLYGADPETWLHHIQTADEAVDTILLVGHNPGLEILVSMLAGRMTGFRPATLAQVNLAATTWPEVRLDGSSHLVEVVMPEPAN